MDKYAIQIMHILNYPPKNAEHYLICLMVLVGQKHYSVTTKLINRYMRVEEVIKSVEEGVNDPHIFKAVFMAGGSRFRKSFVAKKC